MKHTIIFLFITQLFFGAFAAKKKPNIYLIMIEDMGCEMPLYGDNTIPTPAIDQLAKEGTTFDNFYVTQSTCSPSRSSLFTSLYPHQNGHYGLPKNFGYRMHYDVPTLVQLLNMNGYFTGVNYKIHVGPETDIPFHHRYSLDNGIEQTRLQVENFFDHKPKDKPFFFMAQTHTTHRPFKNHSKITLDPPYEVKTREDELTLPQFGKGIRELPKLGSLYEDVALYYNDIQKADLAVGMFMDVLKTRGLEENTIVIFASDHGPAYGRGKTSAYEFSMKVPFIIKWPGVTKAGKRETKLGSLLDVMPTVLEAADIKAPALMEGKSLKPLLLGKEKKWREYVFSEYHNHCTIEDYWPVRTVRDSRYRLIYNLLGDGKYINTSKSEGCPDISHASRLEKDCDTKRVYSLHRRPTKYQLYDLKNDPYELNDLSNDPTHTDVKNRLIKEIHQWMHDTHDPFADKKYLADYSEYELGNEKKCEDWAKEHNKSAWSSPYITLDHTPWIMPWQKVLAQYNKKKNYGKTSQYTQFDTLFSKNYTEANISDLEGKMVSWKKGAMVHTHYIDQGKSISWEFDNTHIKGDKPQLSFIMQLKKGAGQLIDAELIVDGKPLKVNALGKNGLSYTSIGGMPIAKGKHKVTLKSLNGLSVSYIIVNTSTRI